MGLRRNCFFEKCPPEIYSMPGSSKHHHGLQICLLVIWINPRRSGSRISFLVSGNRNIVCILITNHSLMCLNYKLRFKLARKIQSPLTRYSARNYDSVGYKKCYKKLYPFKIRLLFQKKWINGINQQCFAPENERCVGATGHCPYVNFSEFLSHSFHTP